ncbi:MAG: DUF2202 domain-containing protein [Isosphaeraceae bacterium]
MMRLVTASLLLAVVLTSLTGAAPRRGKPARRQATATAAAPLTQTEIGWILHMRQEEKLARDVYLTLGSFWAVPEFPNIARSEANHMAAVKRLIVAYGLSDPAADDTVGTFTDPRFAELYQTLVSQGSASLADAYAVGVAIEQMDIVDLSEALDQVQKVDVRRVFQNLLNASYNHLAAFQSQLAL